MNDRTQENSNAPLFELRDGNLRSATWEREGEYGPQYSTKMTKLYKNDDGDFRETTSFGSKELLRLSELARETHQEILLRQREHAHNRKSNREKSERSDERDQSRFKNDRQSSSRKRGTGKPRDSRAR